jgi:hypothetical protein
MLPETSIALPLRLKSLSRVSMSKRMSSTIFSRQSRLESTFCIVPHRCLSWARAASVTSEALGALPEEASVHLDRGYESRLSHDRLAELGLGWEISGKGKPAPYWATYRWIVERTSSWHNAHKKLVWCTERVGRMIDFWVAFSDVVIIVR